MESPDEIVEEHRLTGFDPEGEPVLRVRRDGRLMVVFHCMPPSWAEDAVLPDFVAELAAAAGAEVAQDDREVFVLASPAADSVDRIRKFLKGYRKAWKSRTRAPSVRDRILEGLREPLAQAGFRLNKSKATFRRRIDDGFQEIGLAFVNYHPAYKFCVMASVAIRTANAIINPAVGMLPAYWKDATTTTAQMEYFAQGKQWIDIASPDELDAALMELHALVQAKMIPFLDQHRDVQALDRSLHSSSETTPPRHTINGMVAQWRAFSGIVIAYLAGNRDFESIADRYRKELAIERQTDHPFNRLVKQLESDR